MVAAHLHLGTIPMTGKVKPEKIRSLPEFDLGDRKDWGSPKLVGVDAKGTEVYILGLGNMTEICCQSMISLLYAIGKADQVLLVETLSVIGLLTRIGGFTSKVLGLQYPGKRLAAIGIIHSLRGLRDLVRKAQIYVDWKNRDQ